MPGASLMLSGDTAGWAPRRLIKAEAEGRRTEMEFLVRACVIFNAASSGYRGMPSSSDPQTCLESCLPFIVSRHVAACKPAKMAITSVCGGQGELS